MAGFDLKSADVSTGTDKFALRFPPLKNFEFHDADQQACLQSSGEFRLSTSLTLVSREHPQWFVDELLSTVLS